jgi:hypothetical protein
MSQKKLELTFKYIIYILLFSTFFMFSHILYLIWIHQDITIFWIWWFEWIKSVIISFIWILIFIFLLIYKDKHEKENNTVWLYSWLLVLFIIISSIFSISTGDFLFWLSEKHQGWLYYISLVFIFLWICIWYKKQDYYKTLNIIFIFFWILWLYWILQKIWIDPLSHLYQTRVSLARISSTLWNANYLAWLSLILLPLTLLLQNKYYKYWLFIFCFLILIFSGSYFWIILASLYFIYLSYHINKYIFIWLLIFIFTFYLQIFNNLWIEKLWSMKSRPYMWISTYSAITHSPKTTLIWNWPDTLQEVFHQYKHPKLNIYETSHYTADRSHNFFLDLIYFFWILWWWLIIFFIIKALFISNNNKITASIILFLLFFSFNIPVSVHFIILIILLAWVYNKNW